MTQEGGRREAHPHLLQHPADGEPGSGAEPTVLSKNELRCAAIELHHLTECYGSLRYQGGVLSTTPTELCHAH